MIDIKKLKEYAVEHSHKEYHSYSQIRLISAFIEYVREKELAE